MLIPYFIIVNHFIADFLLQNDKMAVNKSSSWYWLTMHVLAYMAGICLFGTYLCYDYTLTVALCWILLNGALHWITDFFTSRLNSYLWKKEQRHWFFVSIGFDQLIHYGCLLFSYEWLIKTIAE